MVSHAYGDPEVLQDLEVGTGSAHVEMDAFSQDIPVLRRQYVDYIGEAYWKATGV